MKILKLFLAMLIVLITISCSDVNNPVGPIESDPYIGSYGTERTYVETERWLEVNSNTPFVSIPKGFREKVSLTDKQIENGISQIKNYTEYVKPILDDFYISWKLPLSRDNYIQNEGKGKCYNLVDELKMLQSAKSYSVGNYQIGQDIYLKKIEAILTVQPSELQKQFPAVPFIKYSLQIGDTWIRYKFIDTTTSKSVIETVAEVVGRETINVQAGIFSAYKIKLKTYHYNPDYSFEEGYEYYVPNVGLILKESDMNVSQWNSNNNQTITFRQIIRKELVSFNFISK
ncbi:MAG: hypothetical protein FD143_2877 [Ignavibacteria bacterium]|nr:MAG: hypothetical protein FD143_2877 [Ignavibacteria bacterium]